MSIQAPTPMTTAQARRRRLHQRAVPLRRQKATSLRRLQNQVGLNKTQTPIRARKHPHKNLIRSQQAIHNKIRIPITIKINRLQNQQPIQTIKIRNPLMDQAMSKPKISPLRLKIIIKKITPIKKQMKKIATRLQMMNNHPTTAAHNRPANPTAMVRA